MQLWIKVRQSTGWSGGETGFFVNCDFYHFCDLCGTQYILTRPDYSGLPFYSSNVVEILPLNNSFLVTFSGSRNEIVEDQ